MSITPSSINNILLPELLTQVFTYLSPQDLGRCERVCRLWKDLLVNNETLWRTRYPKDFIPREANARDWIGKYVAFSYYRLLLNVLTFLPSVPFGAKGVLSCTFLYNPNLSMNIEFGCLRDPIENVKQIEQKLFFGKRIPFDGGCKEPYTHSMSVSNSEGSLDLFRWKFFHFAGYVKHFSIKIALPDGHVDRTLLIRRIEEAVKNRLDYLEIYAFNFVTSV